MYRQTLVEILKVNVLESQKFASWKVSLKEKTIKIIFSHDLVWIQNTRLAYIIIKVQFKLRELVKHVF